MIDILNSLPPVLVVAAIVFAFFAIRRQERSLRATFWLAGWVLLLVRFATELTGRASMYGYEFFGVLHLGALRLGALMFLMSMSDVLTDRLRRTGLLITVAAAAGIHSYLFTREYEGRWPYAVCLAVMFIGGTAWMTLGRGRLSWRATAAVAVILLLAVIGIYMTMRGDLRFGNSLMLTLAFAVTAVKFAKAYARWSPGVVLTVGAFSVWSLVFPVMYLLQRHHMGHLIMIEVWDVPKMFVAFGMLLILLEERTAVARAAERQERGLKLRVEEYAAISSRLLSRANAQGICEEVAQAIAPKPGIKLVVLLAEEGRMRVAAHAGLDDAAVAALRAKVKPHGSELIEQLCAGLEQAGDGCFRGTDGLLARTGGNRPELLVPLRSQAGAIVGAVAVVAEEPAASDVYAWESLARNIARAIDRAELERRVLASNQFVTLSQLLKGISHELNNPLTVILGMSEILPENSGDPRIVAAAGAIREQCLLMRRIIEDLITSSQARGYSRPTGAHRWRSAPRD